MALSPTSPVHSLWAKTFSSAEPSLAHLRELLWLSVPQHLRDSADVGMALSAFWIPESVRERLCRKNRLTHEQLASLIGFLTGTHDCGKATMTFCDQIAEVPELEWLANQTRRAMSHDGSTPFVNPAFKPTHSLASDAILRRELTRIFPEAEYTAICTLTSAAGAHHGRPSELPMHDSPLGGERLTAVNQYLDRHGPVWAQAWSELVEDILERTQATAVLSQVLNQGGLDITDQMLLAGLVSIADWIASNQELFELTESGCHTSDQSRAGDALEQLALTPPWRAKYDAVPPFERRFGWPRGSRLRACQQVAVEAAVEQARPALFIICDEMGRGKTEAALLAAEISAGHTGAGGVAFALPSQVTTNAMLPRITHWVESLDQESPHSLRLMHSNAHLSPEFESLIHRTRAISDGADHDEVIAHQWFSGRKGLLSEFTVSTVDQVLMLALQSRYVALRHFGLAGKVVIIDEVHSYDHYTRSYLEKTLTWLAAHGTSVILLSATLASSVQSEFEKAYAEGFAQKKSTSDKRVKRKVELPQPTETFTFPSVSVTSQAGTKHMPVEAEKKSREVRLTTLEDSLEDLQSALSTQLRDGGVVGVVCNTVSRAQLAFSALRKEYGEDVVLLHSQLTVAERSSLERQLVNDLGKNGRRQPSDAHTLRPYRRLVVGTQVLEQSLDVDFDLLVSDFAPVDLLAQRAGRLHRHNRPPHDRPQALREPEMLVRGLNRGEISPTAVPEFESGAQNIYGEYLLLATAAVLRTHANGSPWCIRHDLYPKIEAVYTHTPDIPEAWATRFEEAKKAYNQAKKEARVRAEKFQMPTPRKAGADLTQALGSASKLDADRDQRKAVASVRDIQPTLEAILLWENDGYIYPLPWLLDDKTELVPLSETQLPPRKISRLLAESVVKIPHWLVPEWSIDPAIDELETQGIAAWQDDFRLKGQLLLRVGRDFSGQLLDQSFFYLPAIGFVQPDHVHEFDCVTRAPEGDFYDEHLNYPYDCGGDFS